MREFLEKIKRPTALLAVLALWLALVPALYRTADAAGVGNWTDSGNFSASLTGGGTQDNPYLIQSEQDLAALAKNYTGNTYAGKYFQIENDLDMTDHFWVPAAFYGVLDGNGHSVTGLTIKTTGSTSGLFTNLYGTVKNLRLDVDISITGTSVAARYGGVAGYLMAGIIDNCVVTGKINVNKTAVTEGQTQGHTYVGGIAGNANAAGSYIRNCVNFADITITTTYRQSAAGILGMTEKLGHVINCVNFGNVTVGGGVNSFSHCAGILARPNTTGTTVVNCYNAGELIDAAGGYYTYLNDIYAASGKITATNAWALNSDGTYKAVSENTADCADNAALLTALNAYVTANATNDPTLRSWEMGDNGPIPSFSAMGEDLPTFTADIAAGSGLGLTFYIDRDLLNGTGYTATITKTFADGREAVVKTIALADWTEEDGQYRFSFSDISAKEMTDEITITISNGEATVATCTKTVEGCARDIIRTTDNDKLKTALADMLNYGAACQTHFGYNTNNLASPGVYSDYATAADVTCASAPTDTLNLDSTSLFAKETLTYTFYFKDITADMTAHISYTDYSGQSQSMTVNGSDFVEAGGLFAVNVPGIAIADGRAKITCEVKNGDDVVAKGTDSVEGYAVRTLAANAGNTNLCNALKMLMKFVDSANAYFDSLSA